MKDKLNNSTRAWHIQQIQEIDLTEPKRITISDWRGKRGLPSNALSWVFYKIIGDEIGMATNEVHSDSKIQFGLPILFKSGSNYAHSVALLLDRSGFWQMTTAEQWKLIEPIGVTSKFNSKEMAHYIEQIQLFYGMQGIVLENSND